MKDGCLREGSLFCIFCGFTEEEMIGMCPNGAECDGCCDSETQKCHSGGCDMCDPAEYSDEGYYYSGTGEWSEDDSYIDYLNRY